MVPETDRTLQDLPPQIMPILCKTDAIISTSIAINKWRGSAIELLAMGIQCVNELPGAQHGGQRNAEHCGRSRLKLFFDIRTFPALLRQGTTG